MRRGSKPVDPCRWRAERRSSRAFPSGAAAGHPTTWGTLLLLAALSACTDGGDRRSSPDEADRTYASMQSAVELVLATHWLGPQASALDSVGGTNWFLPPSGAGTAAGYIRCRVVVCEAESRIADLESSLNASLRRAGAHVIWREELGDGVWRLDLGAAERPTHTVALVPPAHAASILWCRAQEPSGWRELAGGEGPLVALVIDDWGQRQAGPAAQILDLPVPLTLAVLPDLPFSRTIAALATGLLLPPHGGAAAEPDPPAGDKGAVAAGTEDRHARRLAAGCPVELSLAPATDLPAGRREILLHLPMQPEGFPDVNPGPGALLVGMAPPDVVGRLEAALASVPGARGVNNHMGSAATADTALMDLLMEQLRARDLLFLDSLTSPRSVAYATARRGGVPALRNHIFLDVEPRDEASIAANLATLVASARSKGQAVGIAHPHAATAAVLARELARYESEGVRFVTVSELIALRTARRTPAREPVDGL